MTRIEFDEFIITISVTPILAGIILHGVWWLMVLGVVMFFGACADLWRMM